MSGLFDKALKALIAEIKTPVGLLNLVSIAAGLYLYRDRHDEYEERLKGLLAQGIGYEQAAHKANELLARKIPDEYVLAMIGVVLLVSLVLSYRAYMRSLPPSPSTS